MILLINIIGTLVVAYCFWYGFSWFLNTVINKQIFNKPNKQDSLPKNENQNNVE